MITDKNTAVNGAANHDKLLKKIVNRLLIVVLLLGSVFYIPAGAFNYREAWIYMAVLILPATITTLYLLENAPDLLERRMRMKEKEAEQKIIVRLSLGRMGLK